MSRKKQKDSPDNMEAVRELLFGKKTEEIDSRIVEMDRSFHAAVDSLEDRINQRLSALDDFVRAEIESANSKINANAERAREEKEATATRISKLNSHCDEEMEKLHVKVNQNHDESRKELFDKCSDLEKQLAKAARELREYTVSEVAGLRHTATDRQNLGDFLIDLGMRLQSNSDAKVSEQKSRGGSNRTSKGRATKSGKNVGLAR